MNENLAPDPVESHIFDYPHNTNSANICRPVDSKVSKEAVMKDITVSS